MPSRSTLCAMVVLALACACDSKGEPSSVAAAAAAPADAPATEADPGKDFATERARTRLGETEAQLAKGEVPSFTACAGTKGYVEELRSAPSPSADVTKLLADIDRVCDHEVPKAAAKAAIAKAEQARAAQPDKKVLSECFSADYNGALKTLKAAADADVPALEQQFLAACPKA